MSTLSTSKVQEEGDNVLISVVLNSRGLKAQHVLLLFGFVWVCSFVILLCSVLFL